MDGLSGNDSMWDDVEVDGAVEVDDAEVDDVEVDDVVSSLVQTPLYSFNVSVVESNWNVESPDEGPPPEGGGI